MKSRPRSLTRSELEKYAADFVAKVVAELREHGELLTVTYLLMDDDFVIVPAFYGTALEKQVVTAAIDGLVARLVPRAVFYVTRGWVSDNRAPELGTFGNGPELASYGPDDTLPAERCDAFCVLAKTTTDAMVAVTPYRVESLPDGHAVTCGKTIVKLVSGSS